MYVYVLDAQTATSVADVDPLQRHTIAHIVCRWNAAAKLSSWLATTADIPIGEALRAAIYLSLDVACLLRVATFHEYLATFILIQCKVSLFWTKRLCRMNWHLNKDDLLG